VNEFKLLINQIQQYNYAINAIFYYPLFYQHNQNQQNQQANQQASIL
jgi:hypothetical protein